MCVCVCLVLVFMKVCPQFTLSGSAGLTPDLSSTPGHDDAAMDTHPSGLIVLDLAIYNLAILCQCNVLIFPIWDRISNTC